MNRRLTVLIISIVVTAVLVAPARAGTYEHHTLSPFAPGIDGWSPRVSAARGFVSVGVDGGGLWAGFFTRNPFDPGDVADWSYAAPADTTAVAWAFDRAVAGIGGGDWNTFFTAISDDRRRLVGWDVPSVNRGWGRLSAGGLSASRLEARLVCGGPGPCHRAGAATTLRLRAARVVLHDGHAPVATAVQGDLVENRVLSGTERLAFRAADRGGGVYRTLVTVDGRPWSATAVDGNGGRCRDVIGGGSPYQFAFRVPCPLAAGATVELATTRLSDGRHTIAVAVEDAAGNRTTAFGPVTRTVANRPRRPAPAPRPTVTPEPTPPPPLVSTEPPPAASPTRAVIHAWLERGRRRTRTATARLGERVRIRGRVTDAEGRPLAATALTMTERLIAGRALRSRFVAAAEDGLIAAANGDLTGADHDERVAGSHAIGAMARRWPAVTGVRTRPDGRYTAFTRVGPSRRIGIAGPGGARAPRLTLRVRAAVSATLVRRGGSTLVRGRVRGSHVPRGTLVELQARAAGRWETRLLVRTRGRGRFAGRLARLPATAIVRARVPGQPRLPYAAGVSPPRTSSRAGSRTSR
jgi:hypothetical protein